MTKRQKRLLAAIVFLVEVPLAVLAWRDLDRRTNDHVRGKKHLWRVFLSINPGNSVIYWLFGRR
ncbi:MAG: hypothetical protein WBP81_24905 [Solirubrobacteraceae bacterium]